MYKHTAARKKVSQALALPVGTGGLNDFDPISNTDPSFLIECTNFFPDTGLLVVRPGYQEWATNLGGPVETIMEYNAFDGSIKRFASTSAGIWDITNPTDAPVLVKAATNGYWSFVNFANAGIKQYLVACNGVDAAVLYDGTTWIDYVLDVAPAAPGEINGIDPNKLIHVMSHKSRLWFIEKNSMTAWYLPVDALGGEAHPLYLGGIFRRGGHLVSVARWSADTGEGMDDRLIFTTSTGEIASYSGIDPDDALLWSLDATFFVAPPLSTRSVTEYGGDLLLLCSRGMVPLSSLVTSEASENVFSKALTRRISRSLMRITALTSPPFPPEVIVHNSSSWVLINLYNGAPDATSPYGMILGDGERPIQFVMNSLTGAWGKFDFPVRTVRAIDNLLFMGTDDGRVVAVTPESHIDNIKLDGTDGVGITASAMGAYTYLENPNANKHAKFIRPVFQSEIKPSYIAKVLPDFRLDRLLQQPAAAVATGNAKWDLSNWDTTNWASMESVYRPWVSANVLGYAFAWQIRVSTSSALGIAAVEWIWEDGGLI